MERRLNKVIPITPKQLDAIERSSKSPLVRRLASTLREAWERIECTTTPEPAPQQRLFDEATGRIPVLVVLYASGAVDVFGPREELSVRVVCYPKVDGASAQLADSCERIVEKMVGKRHAQLFISEHLRAMGMHDQATLGDLLEQKKTIQWLNELKNFATQLKEDDGKF